MEEKEDEVLPYPYTLDGVMHTDDVWKAITLLFRTVFTSKIVYSKHVNFVFQLDSF